jgi:hypothetical protein
LLYSHVNKLPSNYKTYNFLVKSGMLLKFGNKSIHKYLKNRKIIFFIGGGRSGTTFIANIIKKSKNSSSFHESAGDRIACIDSYYNNLNFKQYMEGYRSFLIFFRILLSSKKIYSESNSYLRYSTDILKSLYRPVIFHLVRDGRLVVRSMMNRNTFTKQDRSHSGLICPKKNDRFYNSWSNMSRFQKICWYWANINNSLIKNQLKTVKFEKLISSYEYFQLIIETECKIKIPYKIWKNEISIPKNISKSYHFPEWHYWSLEERCKFLEICGPTMEKLGYPL